MPRETALRRSLALVCRPGSDVDGCTERAAAPELGPRRPWLDVLWAPSTHFSVFPGSGARRVLVPRRPCEQRVRGPGWDGTASGADVTLFCFLAVPPLHAFYRGEGCSSANAALVRWQVGWAAWRS